MNFTALSDPARNVLADGLWFLFHSGKLVISRTDDSCAVPGFPGHMVSSAEHGLFVSRVARPIFIGRFNDRDCWTGIIEGQELPGTWEADNLRALYGKISPDLMQIARFSAHLLHWDRNSTFCGVCGGRNTDKEDERAKRCSVCGNLVYPRLSPAVIVAILDGEKILLAHNKKFSSAIYSLIAGFVEIGENLEECVHREIEEETGLRVKNIRYFGSQPWPFPDSLMMGFIADYAEGEIRVDHNELVDAKWFSPDDMPGLPSSDSIARKIISWYERDYIPSLKTALKTD